VDLACNKINYNNMTSSLSIVTQFEIARAVAKQIKSENESSQHLSGAVIKVMATFAKYINHFSRKSQQIVVCEVPMLGYFVNDETSLEFLPNQFFSQETGIAQSNRKIPKEGVLKKELTIEKIASLCQISDELAGNILQNLVKTIVSIPLNLHLLTCF
jgi:hypothetical protein